MQKRGVQNLMAKRSKRAKATDFDSKTRARIKQRDRNECLFCRLGKYGVSDTRWLPPQIMHYIPRSAGGLGIEENGVEGCQYHHNLMDNGNTGQREEMRADMRKYLKGLYPGWNEEMLYYRKEY